MTLHSKKVFILSLIVLVMVACSFGESGSSGTSEQDLAATEVSLKSTQLAMQEMQLEATKVAMEQQLEQLQPQEQSDEPQPTQEEPQPAPQVGQVSFEGISFSYDLSLANNVSQSIIPADSTENPWWSSPEHVAFELLGYPRLNEYHKPVIKIYSVDEFRAVNENATDIINELYGVLSARPLDPEGGLPFLPVFNAAQMVTVKVDYLEFQNGSGVRFLTQFGQAAWPIMNDQLIYTFQGITNDGKYYVSVIMPTSNAILSEYDNKEVPMDFYETFETYIEDIEVQLNNQPDESFMPGLAELDALVQSISVEK